MSELFEDLKDQIAKGQAVAVVGASVSIGATGNAPCASWTGFLLDGVKRCREIGVLTPKLADGLNEQIGSGDIDFMLAGAETVTAKLGGQKGGEYARWLRESVGTLTARRLDVLEALRDLGIPLATTNYDNLLEEVTKFPAVTWKDGPKVERVLRGDNKGILHLHGHWDRPDSVVLGIRSYEQVLGSEHAQIVLQALQTLRTLVFVGCGAGLRDPNFDRLLEWTGRVFATSEYRRFRLALESEREKLQEQHPPEQRLFVLSYGKTHDELTPFLRSLRISKQSTIDSTQEGGTSMPPCKIDFSRLQRPATTELIGRDAECKELTTAFESEHTAILGLIADGGFGKTAIVSDWLKEIQREVDRYGLTHIYAWTFNDRVDSQQSNTSSAFFIETFEFFDEIPPPQIRNPEAGKGRYLEVVFAKNKSILILDGLEALQEKLDISDERGKISDDAIREFVLQMTRMHRDLTHRLVILTSRLPLWSAFPRFCYHEINLDNLSVESGANLLRQLGVKGPIGELKKASEENSGHCLSLVLLGNAIANYFPDCHIENRKLIYSLVDAINSTSPLDQARRVMEFYEKTISEVNDIILLEMMGLFHMAMEDNLREYLAENAEFAKDVKYLSSSNWNAIAKKLERYGLLAKEPVGQPRTRWNCHPLIREHFRYRLFQNNTKGWRNAHLVLFRYFKRQTGPQPSTLGGLIPVYRAVHHACQAGEYREALALYKSEIIRDEAQGFSTNVLGAATEDIAALQRFFDDENGLSNSLGESDIAWLHARIAFCQTCLGRLGEAIDNRRKQRDFAENQGDLMGAASASEYLSGLYALQGNIFAAEEAAERAISIGEQAKDWGTKMRGLCRLAFAKYLRGAITECGEALERAFSLHQDNVGQTPHLVSEYGLINLLWMLETASTPEEYLAILREAESKLQHDQNWHAPMGIDLMVKGLALWKLGNIPSGEFLFGEAKDTLNTAGYVVYMPYYFNAMGEYWLTKGNLDKASKAAGRAESISMDYGMPLFLIDSKLLMAQILIRKGDIDAAKDIVAWAQQRISNRNYYLRQCEIILLRAEILALENQSQAVTALEAAKRIIEQSGRKSLLDRWQVTAKRLKHEQE